MKIQLILVIGAAWCVVASSASSLRSGESGKDGNKRCSLCCLKLFPSVGIHVEIIRENWNENNKSYYFQMKVGFLLHICTCFPSRTLNRCNSQVQASSTMGTTPAVQIAGNVSNSPSVPSTNSTPTIDSSNVTTTELLNFTTETVSTPSESTLVSSSSSSPIPETSNVTLSTDPPSSNETTTLAGVSPIDLTDLSSPTIPTGSTVRSPEAPASPDAPSTTVLSVAMPVVPA